MRNNDSALILGRKQMLLKGSWDKTFFWPTWSNFMKFVLWVGSKQDLILFIPQYITHCLHLEDCLQMKWLLTVCLWCCSDVGNNSVFFFNFFFLRKNPQNSIFNSTVILHKHYMCFNLAGPYLQWSRLLNSTESPYSFYFLPGHSL